MSNKINLWWWIDFPGNLGDQITPFIVEQIWGKVNYVESWRRHKLVGAGSTMWVANPGDVVWGTGMKSEDQRTTTHDYSQVEFLGVRGPLTQKIFPQAKVIGDPALLAPLCFPRTVEATEEVGYIPHYVDYGKFDIPEEHEINILNCNPVAVLEEMCKYKRIISSSLHGIILAHAYGIPAAWWEPSQNVTGDGMKFRDYGLSVGLDLQSSNSLDSLTFTLPEKDAVKSLQTLLLETFYARFGTPENPTCVQ